MQLGGAVGVAAFGTLYLSLTPTSVLDATHAFAVTTAADAAIALVAAVMAQRATRTPSMAFDRQYRERADAPA
ncbi:MAG: hypothetical protein ABI317_17350 [Gaiellales bacterium]